MSDAPEANDTIRIIRPAAGSWLPNLRELWHSADLVYFLAKRDVTIRYRQTAVGVFWAILQPLVLAAIFAIFLGRLAKVPSGETPYALFALTGMTMWLFMSGGISKTSESTVANGALIAKVYFPRLVVPIAALVAPLVDFVLALVVLIAALLLTGEGPPLQVLLMPIVVLVAAMLTLGVGVWLSAVVVRFRDVNLLVPFGLMVLLWISPILYPLSLLPEEYRTLYSINPMVGLLETFRWTVLPGSSDPGLLLLIPIAFAIVLLVTGTIYFNRAERRFADVI
jgi:lipopolysaccharide transport system permease protein